MKAKDSRQPKKRRYTSLAVQTSTIREKGRKGSSHGMRAVPATEREANVIRDMTERALLIDPNARLLGTRRGNGKVLIYTDKGRVKS